VRQEPFHLGVAAVACHLDRIVVDPEVNRVAIVFEESHDLQTVLTHSEVERLAIVVVRPCQRGIFGDERSYTVEIT